MTKFLRQLICTHPVTVYVTRYKGAHEYRRVVCLKCSKEW